MMGISIDMRVHIVGISNNMGVHIVWISNDMRVYSGDQQIKSFFWTQAGG